MMMKGKAVNVLACFPLLFFCYLIVILDNDGEFMYSYTYDLKIKEHAVEYNCTYTLSECILCLL